MNKRYVFAFIASGIVFYLMTGLLNVAYIYLLSPHRTDLINVDIWIMRHLPSIFFSLYIQFPFLAADIISAFFSGIVGALILKQKKYIIISAPVVILSLIGTVYFFIAAIQYPQIWIVALFRNLVALFFVISGIWITCRFGKWGDIIVRPH